MEILEKSKIAREFVEFLNGPSDELGPKIAEMMILQGLDYRTNGLYFVKVLKNYLGIVHRGGLKEAKEIYDSYCNGNSTVEIDRVPIIPLDDLLKKRKVATDKGDTRRVVEINELLKELLDL